MPKPEITFANIIDAQKNKNAWSMGAGVRDFVPEDVEWKGEETTCNLKTLMQQRGMATIREGMGAYLFMCMAGVGNADGTFSYDMKDIAEPGKMVEAKRAFGQKVEHMLRVPGPDASPEEIAQAKKDLEYLDKCFIRGVKRACERLTDITAEAVKNNDKSMFLTSEVSVLANLSEYSLTNILQDSYLKDPLRVKPNSIVDRLHEIDAHKDDIDVDAVLKIDEFNENEAVEQSNQDFNYKLEDYAEKYNGITNFVSYFGQDAERIIGYVESGATGLPGMASSLAFSEAVKRYQNAPNTPILEIAPAYDPAKINETKDVAPSQLAALMFDELHNLADGRAIDDFESQPELFERFFRNRIDNVELQNKKQFAKEYLNSNANRNNPLYNYGLGVMYMNNRQFTNLQTTVDYIEGDVENVSVKFDNTLEYKDVIKEAFRSDFSFYVPEREAAVELGFLNGMKDVFDEALKDLNIANDSVEGYLGANPLSSYAQSAEDVVNNFKDTLNATTTAPTEKLAKSLNPLLGKLIGVDDFDEYTTASKIDTIKENKASNVVPFFNLEEELEDITSHYFVTSELIEERKPDILEKVTLIKRGVRDVELNNEERRLYEYYVKQSVNEKLQKIKSDLISTGVRLLSRQMLVESGARMAALNPEASGRELDNINANRVASLQKLSTELNELEPLMGGSTEWKNMRAAVAHAEQISRDFAGQPDGLEKMTSAMLMVRDAANKYVEHKLNSGKYAEGDDFKRLQAAKRLESLGKQQCEFLESKLTKSITSVHEEKGYFCADSMKKDIEVLKRLALELDSLGNETFTHSNEFNQMIAGFADFRAAQIEIADANEFDDVARKKLFGYTKKDEDGNWIHDRGAIDRALIYIDAYIEHRVEKGFNKPLYAKRIDAARRVKTYLETIKAGAEREDKNRLIAATAQKSGLDFAVENDINASLDRALENTKRVDEISHNTYAKMKNLCSDLKGKGKEYVVPAERVPDLRDALYNLCAYQMYLNEKEKISNSALTKDKSKYVKLVEEGLYPELLKNVKNDVYVQDFINKYSTICDIVSGLDNNRGIISAVKHIEENRKLGRRIAPEFVVKDIESISGKIGDSKYYQDLCANLENSVEKSKQLSKNMEEGKLDQDLLAGYIANRITLAKAKKLENEKASLATKWELTKIHGEVKNTDKNIEYVKSTPAFTDIVANYKGTENFEKLFDNYATAATGELAVKNDKPAVKVEEKNLNRENVLS